MFPQMLAVVAIFLLMSSISDWFPAIGLNTHIGLIMVYLGGALGVNTFLMYGFFNTIPASIDEAAKLDGAGHARIFFTIILRLAAPILAVRGAAVVHLLGDEFAVASVLLIDTENQTLAVGLTKLVSNPRYADWSAFSAGAVMAMLPVVALFLFLQKYIVGGLHYGCGEVVDRGRRHVRHDAGGLDVTRSSSKCLDVGRDPHRSGRRGRAVHADQELDRAVGAKVGVPRAPAESWPTPVRHRSRRPPRSPGGRGLGGHDPAAEVALVLVP